MARGISAGVSDVVQAVFISDIADWMIEAYLDEDGHLNVTVRDRTGGSVENIREETNTTGDYDEVLLRYTSDTVESAFTAREEDEEE